MRGVLVSAAIGVISVASCVDQSISDRPSPPAPPGELTAEQIDRLEAPARLASERERQARLAQTMEALARVQSHISMWEERKPESYGFTFVRTGGRTHGQATVCVTQGTPHVVALEIRGPLPSWTPRTLPDLPRDDVAPFEATVSDVLTEAADDLRKIENALRTEPGSFFGEYRIDVTFGDHQGFPVGVQRDYLPRLAMGHGGPFYGISEVRGGACETAPHTGVTDPAASGESEARAMTVDLVGRVTQISGVAKGNSFFDVGDPFAYSVTFREARAASTSVEAFRVDSFSGSVGTYDFAGTGGRAFTRNDGNSDVFGEEPYDQIAVTHSNADRNRFLRRSGTDFDSDDGPIAGKPLASVGITAQTRDTTFLSSNDLRAEVFDRFNADPGYLDLLRFNIWFDLEPVGTIDGSATGKVTSISVRRN